MKSLSRILLITLLLAAHGCSVNPVTGERELSLVSPAQEVAIGEENYQPSQQAQGGRYYLDPDVQTYVAEIGRKLAAQSDRPNLPYEFVVLNSSVPNAWALPGGKIAINRGLLPLLEDESELAAVLGHEIVHAAARHSAQQITRGTLLGAGATILGVMTHDSTYGQLTNTAAQIGAAAWLARYGRSAELEADAYGMQYMVGAGYDPQGAVRLQQAFVKLSEGRQSDFISDLFASHPPSQERVEANREHAKKLPAGEAYRDRYQQKIAQIKKDAPAYKAEEEAMKALNDKKPELALQKLDEAVRIQPNEGSFWELRGHALAMQENYTQAEQAFTQAVSKNPEYFRHYFARGTFHYRRNNLSAARADLQRSNQLLATQQASYLLGEISTRNNDTAMAMQYYQSAAQGGGDLGQQAAARFATLELPQNPAKYIASQAFVSDDGYLHIAVRNNGPVPVAGLRVQLADLSAGTATLVPLAETLQPGQQATIATRIGPLPNADAARGYGTTVVTASVRQ